ncbi:hypothetical protein [Nonomuraea rhizosphaerae]|nr:hypothetical protein [Nonomuraea rhizosphaerae]
MRVRSSTKKAGKPGRESIPTPRRLPKLPQRPIAPPRRIPPKGR